MDLCRLPDCPVSVNSYESRLVHSVGFLVEDVKVTLYAGITIVYISHPQNYTRELLQLTNTFSDMAGYKIKKKIYLYYLSIYLSTSISLDSILLPYLSVFVSHFSTREITEKRKKQKAGPAPPIPGQHIAE